MKATIASRKAKAKFSSSHRKEKAGLHKCYAMLIPSQFNPGEAHAIAELRIYWPANNPFACLWVNAPCAGLSSLPDGCHTKGSGTAGGGGYCKLSAAAGEAIRNAGFDLSEDIHGRGESAVRQAMRAIAKALGHPKAMLFETHP